MPLVAPVSACSEVLSSQKTMAAPLSFVTRSSNLSVCFHTTAQSCMRRFPLIQQKKDCICLSTCPERLKWSYSIQGGSWRSTTLRDQLQLLRFHSSVMPTNSSLNIFPSSPLLCSFNASLYPVTFSCFTNTRDSIQYHLYTVTNILLILPLYIFILWVGFQRWRRESPASGQTSNLDVFTYCMASTETLSVFGLYSYSYAINVCSTTIMVFGYFCVFIGSSAQTFFHCLTCIERYLAVVHPIVYLKLKRSHGVTTRNISIVLTWLLSFGAVSFVAMFFPVFPIILYCSVFGFVIMIVCFCSVSVFYVLMSSRMGRDQRKWRAFHTIVGITATLVLRFSGQGASMLILHSVHRAEFHYCEIFLSGFWLCLPSSLVLPLLFLHRNGKLTCR